jgi:hypothetical protein
MECCNRLRRTGEGVGGGSASNFNEQLIKAYDAETKRITALGTGMTQEQVQALAMQTVMEAMNSAPPDPSHRTACNKR